jgi:hypothetical protein
MKIILRFTVLASVLALSCSAFDNEQSLSSAEVLLIPEGNRIHIINDTPGPVYYFVVEQNFAARIDIAPPCNDFQPNLKAHSSVTIPNNEILGWNEGDTHVWYLWTNCSSNGNSSSIQIAQ